MIAALARLLPPRPDRALGHRESDLGCIGASTGNSSDSATRSAPPPYGRSSTQRGSTRRRGRSGVAPGPAALTAPIANPPRQLPRRSGSCVNAMSRGSHRATPAEAGASLIVAVCRPVTPLTFGRTSLSGSSSGTDIDEQALTTNALVWLALTGLAADVTSAY